MRDIKVHYNLIFTHIWALDVIVGLNISLSAMPHQAII